MVFSTTVAFTQSNRKKSKKRYKAELKAEQTKQIRSIIDSKNYTFKAETVKPINTKTMTFTSDFGIEVRGDSIFSYLPYYGNTYVRDFSSHKNSPMGFAQPIYSYSRKYVKSGYKIKIKVKNENEFIDLNFHISKTGYTSLSATFISRQSISYDGEILIPVQKEE